MKGSSFLTFDLPSAEATSTEKETLKVTPSSLRDLATSATPGDIIGF